MYGADNKTPELRPASIKGVMRFWWRAINGDLPLDKLKKQEDEIFGSTEKKSKVIIYPIEIISESDFEISPTPHHKKDYCNNNRENCYFRGNQYMKAKKKKAKIYEFNIKMSIKSNAYLNKNNLEKLFKITTLLGGFGQRSRRGFGSIRVIRIDNNKELYSLEKIEGFIENIPKFPNLTNQSYPYIRDIEFQKSYNSFEKLLETIGKASHDYSCDALGYAKGKNRLASPIYVSIFKFGENDFRPIITTLNNSNVINFKKAIL
jgi:CRISPR-associated protein Cmr1